MILLGQLFQNLWALVYLLFYFNSINHGSPLIFSFPFDVEGWGIKGFFIIREIVYIKS